MWMTSLSVMCPKSWSMWITWWSAVRAAIATCWPQRSLCAACLKLREKRAIYCPASRAKRVATGWPWTWVSTTSIPNTNALIFIHTFPPSRQHCAAHILAQGTRGIRSGIAVGHRLAVRSWKPKTTQSSGEYIHGTATAQVWRSLSVLYLQSIIRKIPSTRPPRRPSIFCGNHRGWGIHGCG